MLRCALLSASTSSCLLGWVYAVHALIRCFASLVAVGIGPRIAFLLSLLFSDFHASVSPCILGVFSRKQVVSAARICPAVVTLCTP